MLKNKMFSEIFTARENGVPEFKSYSAGKWLPAKKFFDVKSPIDGKVIARIPEISKDQIEKTLETAYNAGREESRNYPGEKRIASFLRAADMMKESFEDFANVLVLDAGKPKENARGEVKSVIERLEKTATEAVRLTGTYIPGDWSHDTLESEGVVKREPYGVVLAISSFNYPLFIAATKVVPALLCGNAVILKPSLADPIAPILFARILELSGFPKESFAILPVSGEDTKSIVCDKRVRAITFTGSTEVGTNILKSAGIKNFHMELGGKDPAIVLADAEVDKTVDNLVKGMVSYSGQRCDAIRVILAEAGIYKPLKEKLIEKLKAIEPKNPLEDESAIMGPLINEKTAKYVEEIYKDKDAIKKGAKPLLKFKRAKNYVWPALLECDIKTLRSIRAFREDVFGPLALLVKVRDENEAVEIANSSNFGLDAAIFGCDEARIQKVARKLEAGAVFVNMPPMHGIGYYPFGGAKESGIGREGVGYSIEQLTRLKSIVHNFKGYGVWEYL